VKEVTHPKKPKRKGLLARAAEKEKEEQAARAEKEK
jgi:hypothetical protein